MRCLVTGCEGFVGSHLADYLVGKGESVVGMVFAGSANIDHLNERIEISMCDLRDKTDAERIICTSRPDVVFHLAAQSFVTVSWQNPEETLRTNVLGSLFLLEALRKAGSQSTVIVVGSSSVYGPCTEHEVPLTEDREFRPTSAYAVSKAAEDMLAYFYWRAYGMRVIRVRPFNMTGPRKVSDACSDFARGIVEVGVGLRRYLEVGNLETIRDFTDGRDVARAMRILSEKGSPGEAYNLCSGHGHRMRDVLHKLIELSGYAVEYVVKNEKLRPFDDPIYVGDNSKLKNLGWEPEIPFEKTLIDMLGYWRQRITLAPTR
jgi:GDP-4-dehydro-6-deoxy-D-mannose reductase